MCCRQKTTHLEGLADLGLHASKLGLRCCLDMLQLRLSRLQLLLRCVMETIWAQRAWQWKSMGMGVVASQYDCGRPRSTHLKPSCLRSLLLSLC